MMIGSFVYHIFIKYQSFFSKSLQKLWIVQTFHSVSGIIHNFMIRFSNSNAAFFEKVMMITHHTLTHLKLNSCNLFTKKNVFQHQGHACTTRF
ncbi:MAG: hypothetical protein WCG25_07280 [bacterium]